MNEFNHEVFDFDEAGPTDAGKEEKRPRRFLQIRLQTLILLLTSLAVCLAVWTNYIRPYLVEHDIRQSIELAGGACVTRHGPDWLESILGPDHCQLITQVDLSNVDFARLEQANQTASGNGDTPPTPAELWQQIGEISELGVLRLGGTPVTDEIVAGWTGLETLRELDLRETNICSAAYWPAFPLELLDVSRTSLDDAGARGLARYDKLRSLNLNETLITGTGIEQLSMLSNLQELSIIDTAISPRDRSQLIVFRNLNTVSVGLTRGGGFGDDLGAHIWPMSGSIGPTPAANLLLEPPQDVASSCALG